MLIVIQPAISRQGALSMSNWLLSDRPMATPAAPTAAPANEPTLHEAWKPGIRARPAFPSTAMAWVFIDTSSVPWNAPHAISAMNSAASDLASPRNGPATQ